MINAAIVPEWKGKPNPLTKKISSFPNMVMMNGKIPLKQSPELKALYRWPR